MPCFRGIDISLIAVNNSDLNRLPEFPHPDGPSAALDQESNGDNHAKTPLSSPNHPNISQASPRVSVYVPSQPKCKFFFDYKVVAMPPAPAGSPEIRYLFFKVIINGRQIVSWGLDLEQDTTGSTWRALYGPGREFQRPVGDGRTMLTEAGIEARCFWFLPEKVKSDGSGVQSVANDGGLIEVQVFRARTRRRRSPTLDAYRSQDKYGVGVISNGLLDKPQKARFYDYNLVDPTDCPYATFRFHYRSWENLEQLHIIPRDEAEIEAPVSESETATLYSVDSHHSDDTYHHPSIRIWDELEEFGGQLRKEQHDTTPRAYHSSPAQMKYGFSRQSYSKEENIFDDTPISTRSAGSKLRRISLADSYFLKSPPQLNPSPSVSERMPQPSKSLRDSSASDFLARRPLPDLPLPDLPDESDVERAQGCLSGRSSVCSRAPSITPSLLQYIEGESFVSESFELGVAKGVDVVHNKRSALRWPNPPKALDFASEWQNPVPERASSLSGVTIGSPDADDGKGFHARKDEDLSESDYQTSVASTDSFYRSPRSTPFNNLCTEPGEYDSVFDNYRYTATTYSPVQMDYSRRESPTARAGKISPKAKQLLGDEVDFSANFAFSPTAGRGDNSRTLKPSDTEWIKARTVTPERDSTPRQASLNFLAKLWSPRNKNRDAGGKTSASSGSRSLKELKKKAFSGPSGSSLVVGLGGHIGH